MIEVVRLQCPSCAGKLEVAKDLEQFACGYCGTEVVVRRGGGTISLSPVVEGLQRVERGVDRTASELAIKRLEGEVASFRTHLETHRTSKSNNEMLIGAGSLGIAAGGALLFSDSMVGAVVMLLAGVFVTVGVLNRSTAVKHAKEWEAAIRQREDELRRHREVVRL